MGFNLIPLSVIPEIRITDKGLVTVPGMQDAAADPSQPESAAATRDGIAMSVTA